MCQNRGIIHSLTVRFPDIFFLSSAILDLKCQLAISFFLNEYLEYLKEVTMSEATARHHMRIVLLHALRSNVAKISKERYKYWIECWREFSRKFSNDTDCFANI